MLLSQKTCLASPTSHRPLHDLCMCTEAVRIGQMLDCLKKQRCIPLEIKTDSILYRRTNRAKHCLAELTFDNLHTLRDQFEGRAVRLNEFAAMAPMDGHETVFRVQAAVEKDRLHIDPSPPTRSWTVDLPNTSWRDLTPSQAEEAVLNGEGLLVEGIAGTGKTTFLRGVVERLRSLGKRIDVLSKKRMLPAPAQEVGLLTTTC